jgi:hypothetical protein
VNICVYKKERREIYNVHTKREREREREKGREKGENVCSFLSFYTAPLLLPE